MIAQFLAWYLVVQLITVVSLPLAATLFVNLPDRGYAFAKSLGILLVGFVLWLGTSYGLLRNELGGAWLAVMLVALASFALSWGRSEGHGAQPRTRLSALAPRFLPTTQYMIVVELLFLLAFAVWAYVRAHDPAANHTEKPMDLMFMNSIWVSPTYPPRDAWLSGYAISYYYFGYWLLTTLGRLAGQPPEIAYNVGQACWFGLLLIGALGVVYNLLRRQGQDERTASIGGLLGAIAVGVTGNLQVVFEWLYANGMDMTGLARWFAVNGFPENAAQTGHWYIDFNWWWWRSSRVLQDLDLAGNHQEVIDEFPMFSYVLGDNHPHVLAMPIVLLGIGLIMNLFFSQSNQPLRIERAVDPTSAEAGSPRPWLRAIQAFRPAVAQTLALFPLGWAGVLLNMIVLGALVFLNTWDFPPYWLLLAAALLAVLLRPAAGQTPLSFGRALLITAGMSVAVVVGVVLLYLPYFLTAQSQAGGFVPNLFHPTRLPQFLLMFAYGLAGVGALLSLAWPMIQPTGRQLFTSLGLIYGGPLLLLFMTLLVGVATPAGRALLQRIIALPEGRDSYLPFIVERWSANGLTFLLLGALLAVTVALLWQLLEKGDAAVERPSAGQRAGQLQALTFALLLAAVGLLLVYAPEFIYLRDNFGWRMNTIFKFYYQGWLLFGLASSYAIITVLGGGLSAAGRPSPLPARILAALSALCITLGLIFPAAAAYSKTNGFSAPTPTLDAIAYVTQENPAEAAAITWVRANTAPDALIVQALGLSYHADLARISAATGRPALLGWNGHEGQWRGRAYGEMAQGREEALQLIYRTGSPEQIAQLLALWQIDYVYVGRAERAQYQMSPLNEERLAQVMDLVFEQDDVRIYQRRSSP